jgi:Uma2 family endonuclease
MRNAHGELQRDEVWNGVVIVSPSPTVSHQRISLALARLLAPLAEARGLECFNELDLHEPGRRAKGGDYMRPDVVIARPEDLSVRAIEGHAELVIEVLSPRDRSRLKFPFYARCGVAEYWLVDPDTRQPEIYVLRGDAYEQIQPDAHGVHRAPMFDLELSVTSEPKLRIGSTSI